MPAQWQLKIAKIAKIAGIAKIRKGEGLLP
jgi:hypothetical protein